MQEKTPLSSRASERLTATRRRFFVGRRAELELFRQALSAKDSSFAVLYLFGPGGVGKTTLLREYAGLAAEQGYSVYRLDGRDIEPSPQGFLLALSHTIDPVVSFLLKEDSRAKSYAPHLENRRLAISFMTVAESFQTDTTMPPSFVALVCLPICPPAAVR
ncbi:MAG: hypothetical protein Kow0063_35800 [Anaerolineae bacterium]